MKSLDTWQYVKQLYFCLPRLQIFEQRSKGTATRAPRDPSPTIPSYIIPNKKLKSPQHESVSLGSHPLGSAAHTKRRGDQRSLQTSRATATNMLKKVGDTRKYPALQANNITSTEPYCHVKLDSIMKLKDSTKKLLCLLENIQSKSHTKHTYPVCTNQKTVETAKPIPTIDMENSVTDVYESALKRLETQTRILETFPTADEDDDCSVFKRLTRKCNCLNQQEYNDFVIHFNEDTKYCTSTAGEIIKNLRILKKFLYMGGEYSKRALMFLNEGLEDSSYAEKVEIIQGCAHADMCNVFEDVSIVITCIAWPYKYESYGDTVTQELAAAFVLKLAQLEEGRRYLKYTSKLVIDIRKVLKKKGCRLNVNTLEALRATLDAMQDNNETDYNQLYSIPGDEGFGSQTMKALIYYRHYMTLGEIFTHLDLLSKLSTEDNSKIELMNCLGPLVTLFQEMLLEYNNSEMNIIITGILNNIVSKSMLTPEPEPEPEASHLPRIMMVADTATEPIVMINECNQMPITKKKLNRSKRYLHLKHSKGSTRRNGSISNFFDTAVKYKEKNIKNNIIIVPIEK